jgi:hypothetical protein
MAGTIIPNHAAIGVGGSSSTATGTNGAGDIVVNLTANLDGRAVAQGTYRYTRAELLRDRTNLGNVGLR